MSMMKESEYLIQVLKEWCSRFEGINVRYAYDANTSYHIIEVDPESIRRGSEQYKQAELGLWISFAEKFPESDLLVCKPARSNDMSNCLFQNKRDFLTEINWDDLMANVMVHVPLKPYTPIMPHSISSNLYCNLNDYALAA